jgi:tripartite-type tricarboxylate transporter receptor subunit TctC
MLDWMMKLPRRQFLRLTAGTATLLTLPRIASALDYPTRPVRIIDGFPPGGASDIVARLTAQWLSRQLHQQFIVENRPGASSNIAAEAVVQAPADGYTLLLLPRQTRSMPRSMITSASISSATSHRLLASCGYPTSW